MKEVFIPLHFHQAHPQIPLQSHQVLQIVF
jgi:hypothetical protein